MILRGKLVPSQDSMYLMDIKKGNENRRGLKGVLAEFCFIVRDGGKTCSILPYYTASNKSLQGSTL
jgi:hypothetical protein